MAELVRILFTAILAILLMAGEASAEKRLALVMGAAAYHNVTVLSTAVRDAQDVGKKLSSLGFDTTVGLDLDRAQMADHLAMLAKKITPGDIVLFYFAGHGANVLGDDFLIAVDSPEMSEREERELADSSLAVSEIVDALQSPGTGTLILIVDSSRSNPFRKGITRSLAIIDKVHRNGLFVLYASDRGQEAFERFSDGDKNPNSAFTRVLLRALDMKGLTLPEVAKYVQTEVTALARAAGHEQVPAYYDSTVAKIVLHP